MNPLHRLAQPLTQPVMRLPAPVLNGISVGLGLATMTALIAGLAGLPAAITASSGAAAASVADTVSAPQAKASQMLPAVTSSVLVATLVAIVHAQPLALNVVGLLVILSSIMWMSWGKRGGTQTFVMVLTLIFQMAAFSRQPMDAHGVLRHLTWVCVGAVAMAIWSQISIRVLAARYRTLALCDSIEALATLMRAQAAWTRQQATRDTSTALPTEGLMGLIQQQAAMADVFQSARDLLYSQARQALPGSRTLRQIDALIHTVNLRDVVLACQLDLDRLPADASTTSTVQALADQMMHQADALEALARSQRLHVAPCSPPAAQINVDTPEAASTAEQAPVLVSLARRSQHMRYLVTQLDQALHGTSAAQAAPSGERAAILLTLVSPTQWTWPPLRAQLHLDSPVLRYALRATLAVTCAAVLAPLLPWSSHPYWIWMAVAVIMRGNLEQTLARRDARVQGTLVGCLLASGLLWLAPDSAWLFVVLACALSLAHGYVLINYRVTAAAGAVLALVQGHLFAHGHAPALIDAAERMADTLIGAGLAWAFSYVLPSWERQQLPRLVTRLLRAQAHYAHHALRWHLAHPRSATRSHARREVYDVLWLLTQSLQRMGKEPGRVRSWAQPLEALLIHSHRLISHLAGIKGLLTVRHEALQADLALPALQAAEQRIQACLKGEPMETVGQPLDEGLILADADLPGDAALTAWLILRLDQTRQEAGELARAARQWQQTTQQGTGPSDGP